MSIKSFLEQFTCCCKRNSSGGTNSDNDPKTEEKDKPYNFERLVEEMDYICDFNFDLSTIFKIRQNE